MKKFIITIVAFIYLGTSSGIAVNVHYCMGKFSSVDLVHGKDKCSKCGMKKGTGSCCKDEYKLVKADDAYKPVYSGLKFLLPVVFLDNLYHAKNNYLRFSQVIVPTTNNSPPEHSRIPLNILYCVYRI